MRRTAGDRRTGRSAGVGPGSTIDQSTGAEHSGRRDDAEVRVAKLSTSYFWLKRLGLVRLVAADQALHAADDPVEEVTRFPEARRAVGGAEHDDGDLRALRDAQQRREAVAGLADEAGLAAADVDVGAEELVGAVDGERRGCSCAPRTGPSRMIGPSVSSLAANAMRCERS